ncbi:thiolase family protein [Actinophytocola sp.]|uniref:thiolase family protein n=1 Tax=Actinophytocola sp. TaxID=1872138 RepID=UPI003D6BF3A9
MTTEIIGAAERTPSRSAEGVTVPELLVEIAGAAVDDAEIALRDVDGLLIAPRVIGSPLTMPATVGEYLGSTPSYLDIVDLGGATAVGMIARASAAIATGLCRRVLCVLADTLDPKSFYQRPVRWEGVPAAEFERPFGPMGTTAGYGLIAQRHAFEFGTTDEQRVKIAVDERANAAMNPAALYHGTPLSTEDVLASDLIADPLHRHEIVTPCTGAAAFVVAGDGAGGARRVSVAGYGELTTHVSPAQAGDLMTSGLAGAARRAFDDARVAPPDVDVALLYDCYTIAVLIALEDAGFCAKGRGGPFVAEHDLTFRGDFPLNPHGGQLSFGQPGLAGGAGHVVEAMRQLTDTAGDRQVDGCELAFVSGNGGIMGEQACTVLKRV